MPHNLYLHSHLVKTRRGNASSDETYAPLEESISPTEVKQQIKYASIDSIISLFIASLVNSSILIVAAASFHKPDIPNQNVANLETAQNLLENHLGRFAGILFGLGLFLSGQSSTITGTLAGQVVMEGFLGTQYHITPWIRRLITRALAIIPAILVAVFYGDDGINELLVLSQVVLSLQLPFAIWPLVYFTSSKNIMVLQGNESTIYLDLVEEQVESFENSRTEIVLAFIISILITVFNLVLFVSFLI